MTKMKFLIASCLLGVCDFAWGQGSLYAGLYTRSARIEYANKSNFIIKGLEIGNISNHCITLLNCHNVTIKNCKLGPSKREGVYLYKCTNVTIINCSMEKVETGVLAEYCSRITFEHNEVKNVTGPIPHGQMIQLAYCSGGGHSIRYNVSENILEQSYPEDIINIYKSSGTTDSPIIISNNWIRGGGPSKSGGGIMIGDNGGSYTFVENNILVDPGQYGIAIAGGHHNSIKNNKVYSKQQSFNNVGIYAWEQYGLPCHDLTISNNEVNYKSASGSLNNWWFSDNVGIVTGKATNLYCPSLTLDVLPTQIIGRAMLPAPRWTSGWPCAKEVVKQGFTACVNLNEAGTSYYIVLPTGSVSPNSNQVKAGKDAFWNTVADNMKGYIPCVSGTFEYKLILLGLTENKSYDVYFVAENKELILQPAPLRVVVNVR